MRGPNDIPPRFEHKYLLTLSQADCVRRELAASCDLDPFSAASPTGRYLITSLYLDTPHLSCFQASARGEQRRYKLRVRRYGKDLGDSPVFLEVKERVGEITIKRRTVIPTSEWLERAKSGGGVTDAERAFTRRRDRDGCIPVMLVRYEREAWKGRHDVYARATFDERIQFQRCSRWSLDGDGGGFSAADDPTAMGETDARVLLELKFERGVPRWMVGIMRRLELVRRGYSKYGVGTARTFGASLLDAHRRAPVPLGSRDALVGERG